LVCDPSIGEKSSTQRRWRGFAGTQRRCSPRWTARLWPANGEADHLHLLIEYPPKLSVSGLVNAFKGTSSRLLREQRPDLARRYWRGTWGSGSDFAASTAGATLAVIRGYVEQQRASPSP
jgi:putative transposase